MPTASQRGTIFCASTSRHRALLSAPAAALASPPTSIVLTLAAALKVGQLVHRAAHDNNFCINLEDGVVGRGVRSGSRDPRRTSRLLKSYSRAHALATTPSPGIQTCSIFLSSLSSFLLQPDPVFEFREKCGIVLSGSFSAKLHLSNILVNLSTCQNHLFSLASAPRSVVRGKVRFWVASSNLLSILSFCLTDTLVLVMIVHDCHDQQHHHDHHLVSFPDPLAIESEAENLSNHYHPGHLVLCSSLCQQMVRLAAGHAAP